MAFEALAEHICESFDLPVHGTTYTVQPPNARDGLWLQAVVDAGESQLLLGAVSKANRALLSDDKERTAYQMALGSCYERMLDDGVPWPVLKHAGLTAVIFWTRGRELAEAHWAGRGKALAADSQPDSQTTQSVPPTDGSVTTDGSPTGL